MGQAFTPASVDAVNAFAFGEVVLFRHYFEAEEVFDRLRPFYDPSQYRFEIPAEEFDSIREFLREHGHGLRIVDPNEFAVAVEKYTEHPENIFRTSVFQKSTTEFHVFVLKDRESVDQALRQGAVPVAEAEISISLPDGSLPET